MLKSNQPVLAIGDYSNKNKMNSTIARDLNTIDNQNRKNQLRKMHKARMSGRSDLTKKAGHSLNLSESIRKPATRQLIRKKTAREYGE